MLKELFRLRLFVAPLPMALAAWLAFTEAASWRRALLAVTVTGGLTTLLAVELRFRRRGVQPTTAPYNVLAGAVVLPFFILATGAINSPILPAILPMSFVATLLLERRSAVITIACLMVWVIVLGTIQSLDLLPDLVPRQFSAPSGGYSPFRLWLGTILMCLFVLGPLAVGTRVRAAFDATLRRTLEARDELLRTHADQNRLLTTLSAEIAHEIKNPLASVKGLAALVAKDLDGKSAERMAVLRREVDRMQALLEGFLNFSRPLGPLSQEPVDIAALGATVIALHEGLWSGEMSLHVAEGARTEVRADPRKIKQILINLVQNAIEASPAGGEIALAISSLDGLAKFAVLDRGPGLAADVAPRVFDAGITTKASGSGLGLTIARSLARQHGGEIALRPRDGGGCVAELTLPEAGVATPEPAAAAP